MAKFLLFISNLLHKHTKILVRIILLLLIIPVWSLIIFLYFNNALRYVYMIDNLQISYENLKFLGLMFANFPSLD